MYVREREDGNPDARNVKQKAGIAPRYIHSKPLK